MPDRDRGAQTVFGAVRPDAEVDDRDVRTVGVDLEHCVLGIAGLRQKGRGRLERMLLTEHAPWYVIPADNKWFTRLAVADAIIDAMEKLDLKFPKIDDAKKKELAVARKLLMKK